MPELEESLSRFKGPDYIPLQLALNLFPIAADNLNSPAIRTAQISHEDGRLLPSAMDKILNAGGSPTVREALAAQRPEQRYPWTVFTACEDEPMAVPEIERYASLLGIGNTLEISDTVFNLYDNDELINKVNVVHLRRDHNIRTDETFVLVQPSRIAFLASEYKPDRPVEPSRISRRIF